MINSEFLIFLFHFFVLPWIRGKIQAKWPLGSVLLTTGMAIFYFMLDGIGGMHIAIVLFEIVPLLNAKIQQRGPAPWKLLLVTAIPVVCFLPLLLVAASTFVNENLLSLVPAWFPTWTIWLLRKRHRVAVKDHFAVLGLPRTTTIKEIKSTFRRLALSSHPDKTNDPELINRFLQAQDAHSVLSSVNVGEYAQMLQNAELGAFVGICYEYSIIFAIWLYIYGRAVYNAWKVAKEQQQCAWIKIADGRIEIITPTGSTAHELASDELVQRQLQVLIQHVATTLPPGANNIQIPIPNQHLMTLKQNGENFARTGQIPIMLTVNNNNNNNPQQPNVPTDANANPAATATTATTEQSPNNNNIDNNRVTSEAPQARKRTTAASSAQ